MNLKIAQIMGLNTDQKAAQVTYQQRDGNTFLAVLIVASDDAFTKGRQTLSELNDFYFEYEGTPAQKLTAAFGEAETKLQFASEWDLCLGVISGKVLYLIGKGEVATYLRRSDKLLPLTSPDKSGQLISGFLEAGDRLLFATQSLITFLGPELEKSLQVPIESFEEEVGGKIGASDLEEEGSMPDEVGQGLAALAFEIAEEKTEIASLPEEIEENVVNQEASGSRFTLPLALLSGMVSIATKAKNYFPKSGRNKLVLAIVLIVIILAGIGYQYKSSRDAKRQAQFNQTLQVATDSFNAAKGLASLNLVEAKNKLDSAKDELSKALALKPKDQKALDLKKQIEDQSPQILQQASVSDFPLFLDMDLVKKNFRASQMSLSKDKLLFLDPGAKTLVVINLSKKSNQILAGSDKLGEATFASLNGGLAFVYSKDKGVLKIDTANSKISTVAKIDENLGEVKDLYGFAGNVYLLTGEQIWKYLPAGDTYSDKREYLTKEAKADFSGALRMQIESSVYVLKQEGEILRFTKGEKDSFSLSGLPSNIKDPKSIFTSSDTDNLYVLDSGNSRLLTLTKTGAYKGQMTGAKFADATDLVVDEEEKKVYLLEGSKIYSVDLK